MGSMNVFQLNQVVQVDKVLVQYLPMAELTMLIQYPFLQGTLQEISLNEYRTLRHVYMLMIPVSLLPIHHSSSLGRAWVSRASGTSGGTRGRPSRGEGTDNSVTLCANGSMACLTLPLIIDFHTLSHTHRVVEAFLETGERKEIRAIMEYLDLLDQW